jgi:hypothetical protein
MQNINVVPLSKRKQPSLAITVRQNDHTVISSIIAERRLAANTLIIDAKNHDRHESLRIDAGHDGRSLWLDTQALELSLPFGVTDSHKELPWADLAATRKVLAPSAIVQLAGSVADFVARGSYQGVLAPTHYLQEESQDWLAQDSYVAQELRTDLDRRGLAAVKIIYPLVATMRALHDKQRRTQIIKTLSTLPADQISLRIVGFGKNSGPIVVRNIIAAIRELRSCNSLLLIERAGLIGQALYAMGLVDNIETGIAAGETYDVSHRLKPPSARRGGAYQGVVIESLGTTVDIKIAKALFAGALGRTRFACSDLSCCPQGAKSMIANRRRHSLLSQQRQFERLAALPPAQRFAYFLDDVYTPICDMLSRAGEIAHPFHEAHRRSLSIKEMLKAQLQDAIKAKAIQGAPRALGSIARVVRIPSQNNTGKSES